MQPEIIHRCDSCGAALREPAMFCPECGKPLSAKVDRGYAESKASEEFVEPAGNAVLAGLTQSTTASEAAPAEMAMPSAQAKEELSASTEPERHSARDRTRETLHRASSVARGAIEDNLKRVDKVRHVSTVMLEEAHYDPSLRFVLVALGLFVLFIVLLVLSKVMG